MKECGEGSCPAVSNTTTVISVGSGIVVDIKVPLTNKPARPQLTKVGFCNMPAIITMISVMPKFVTIRKEATYHNNN